MMRFLTITAVAAAFGLASTASTAMAGDRSHTRRHDGYEYGYRDYAGHARRSYDNGHGYTGYRRSRAFSHGYPSFDHNARGYGAYGYGRHGGVTIDTGRLHIGFGGRH